MLPNHVATLSMLKNPPILFEHLFFYNPENTHPTIDKFWPKNTVLDVDDEIKTDWKTFRSIPLHTRFSFFSPLFIVRTTLSTDFNENKLYIQKIQSINLEGHEWLPQKQGWYKCCTFALHHSRKNYFSCLKFRYFPPKSKILKRTILKGRMRLPQKQGWYSGVHLYSTTA